MTASWETHLSVRLTKKIRRHLLKDTEFPYWVEERIVEIIDFLWESDDLN